MSLVRPERVINALILLALLTAPLFPLHAATGEFQPNHIISDEELTAYTSLSRAEIQAFLVDQGGKVSTMSFNTKDGITMSAADIIFAAAQEHHINPKYLLVKLQKEQSLLTAAAPTQKQLDWATGYGVCDACSMDDPAIQKFKGFGIQVDNAAGIMRWYFDHFHDELWIRRPGTTFLIDGISVSPANRATAFLYTYTPHLEGNKNFWTLWRRWFLQTYPDGTLVKTKTSPAVYLIRDGQRRPFLSMNALASRFDPKAIVTISEAEMNRYETGRPLSFPNYSILRNGTEYYLVDYDTVRPFADESVVRKLGYHPDEVIDILPEDLIGFSKGTSVTENSGGLTGALLKIKETGSLYYVRDGMYHPVFEPAIASVNFPALAQSTVPISSLADLIRGEPIVLRDGTLVSTRGSDVVYVMEKGKKRRIPSTTAFTALGYNKKQIVIIAPETLESYETGQSIYYQPPETTGKATPVKKTS